LGVTNGKDLDDAKIPEVPYEWLELRNMWYLCGGFVAAVWMDFYPVIVGCFQ
jgi:hypothetical protein